MRQAVGSVEMMVRAEVASVTLPIESVLALKEGDLLRLNAPAAGGDHAVRRQGARAHRPPGPQRLAPRRAGHRADRRADAMSAEDALQRLGQSTGEACLGVLEMFAAGKVSMGEVTTLQRLQGRVRGRAGADRGDERLLRRRRHRRQRLPDHLDGARNLAASMMGMDEPEDPNATELSELELSAVSEAMNQMMASAAAATSVVLGTEVEIGTPETKTFTSADEIADELPGDPARRPDRDDDLRRARPADPARPERVRRAHVERARRHRRRVSAVPAGRRVLRRRRAARAAVKPSLAGIPVRVWAELGRARMPSAQVVGLPAGAVVELDKQADDAIDLYVNGTQFATGRLVVVDGTDWAVRIEHVLDQTNNSDSGMEVAGWPESW